MSNQFSRRDMSNPFGKREPRVTDLSQTDAIRLEESVGPLLAEAKDVSWYDEPGVEVDLATARLCLLRRARCRRGASVDAGDDKVRLILGETDKDTVVWLLSRAISYMDEQGFPDLVPGAWLDE